MPRMATAWVAWPFCSRSLVKFFPISRYVFNGVRWSGRRWTHRLHSVAVCSRPTYLYKVWSLLQCVIFLPFSAPKEICGMACERVHTPAVTFSCWNGFMAYNGDIMGLWLYWFLPLLLTKGSFFFVCVSLLCLCLQLLTALLHPGSAAASTEFE